jgi:hypothetical protein
MPGLEGYARNRRRRELIIYFQFIDFVHSILNKFPKFIAFDTLLRTKPGGLKYTTAASIGT